MSYQNNEIAALGCNYTPTGKQAKAVVLSPNSYSVGMTGLGLHTVYGLINDHPDVFCDRFFADNKRSLALGLPLAQFEVILITISFELDFLTLGRLLHQQGIALAPGKRDQLLIFGGACATINPTPCADWFDAILVGEGEQFLVSLAELIAQNVGQAKSKILGELSNLPGVFLPANSDTPPLATYQPKLDQWAIHSRIITPKSEFGDSFLIEISRGCPHRCAFCAAGHNFGRPRFRSLGSILQLAALAKGRTQKLGLVGTAVSDHPQLIAICQALVTAKWRFSFSSFRANRLSYELAKLIYQGGNKSVTIAPEAGSSRLRELISKDLSTAAILTATENASRANIPNLKLYFLLGIPGETRADQDAIVSLSREIHAIFTSFGKQRGSIGNLHISLGVFVPKMQTPWADAPLPNPKQMRKDLSRLRSELVRLPNCRVDCASVRSLKWQHTLSCGGRDTAYFVEQELGL